MIAINQRRAYVAILACTAIFVAFPQTSAVAASPSTELKNIFSKMDRQLCRSLQPATCKRHAKQNSRKAKAARTKPAKASPATSGIEKDKKTKNAKPASQTIRMPSNDAPPPQPEIKRDIPIPTLKPIHFSNEATTPSVPVPVEKKLPIQKLPQATAVLLPAPVMSSTQPVFPTVHGMPNGTPTGEACFQGLANLGVSFTTLTTPLGTTACSVSDAVQLQSLTFDGDTLQLPDAPTLNCGFASKFAQWLKTEANPIVESTTGKTISAIGTGPGYQCRGRNGDSTAKLSEHAFGNAVDIERIILSDGVVINVKDAITAGAKFQPALASLRATACQYFTTVLGPGANAAHATHFHFDLARRGKKGNHTMCQ